MPTRLIIGLVGFLALNDPLTTSREFMTVDGYTAVGYHVYLLLCFSTLISQFNEQPHVASKFLSKLYNALVDRSVNFRNGGARVRLIKTSSDHVAFFNPNLLRQHYHLLRFSSR